jgi:hypothetical protein
MFNSSIDLRFELPPERLGNRLLGGHRPLLLLP